MRSITLFTAFCFSVAGLAAATGGGGDKNAPYDPFDRNPDYHRVQIVNEKTPLINPFHRPDQRAQQAATPAAKSVGPNLAAVTSKFQDTGLTGVIPASGPNSGLIVLGGVIFHEGDEIAFVQPGSRKPSPLLPEHKVVLKSVTSTALSLIVTRVTDAVKVDTPHEILLQEFSER